MNSFHQEVGSDCDALSDVNSEYMKLPLPEGIDDHVESPEYEPSIGFEENFVPPTDTFSNDDAINLRRVIGDACAATPTVLSVTMPWELPGINLVLGDEADIVPTPVLGTMPVSAREFVVEMPSHRVARVEHIRGSYQEVIDFRLTLDETEINECSWQRALEKWYIVFARGREAWPKGYDIDDIIANRGVGGLRPIFGTRSHNTVVKRANSIIRYTHWFLKNGFSVNPFPISNIDLEDYLEALQLEGASPSASNSFIEAIRFCDKVLNIQGLSETISPKALNLSEMANSNRREKRQARTLTVQEVKSLESFMADERNVMIDRFACGCFLFALFSEVKRWLLCVLKKALGKDPDATTIHCLKSTALSWAGKAGLGTEVRQVLGHHSTGKKSHEIYNRDLLAEPLRQLETLLQRIRTGAFLPDASRSGMVTEKTISDPASTYKMAPIPEEASDSCSESSSTDSSSAERSSQEDELPGLYDPYVDAWSLEPTIQDV